MKARSVPSVLPCKQDPDLFSAPDGEKFHSIEHLTRLAEAKALCLDCPIMLACRDEGRRQRQPGIWGGECDEERAAAGYLTLPKHRRDRSKKVSLAA